MSREEAYLPCVCVCLGDEMHGSGVMYTPMDWEEAGHLARADSSLGPNRGHFGPEENATFQCFMRDIGRRCRLC